MELIQTAPPLLAQEFEAGMSTPEIAMKRSFEPLLDSKQTAALLGIHPKTLQRMARRDEVPAHRIGDLWKYRASELDAWLRSRVSSKSHSCRN